MGMKLVLPRGVFAHVRREAAERYRKARKTARRLRRRQQWRASR